MLALPDVRRSLCDDRILPRDAVACAIADAARDGLGLWIAECNGGFAGMAALKPMPQVLGDRAPGLDGAAPVRDNRLIAA